MDAVTATRDPPVLPLGGGGIEQARIPSERDGNGPPVPQADTQGVFREFHIGNALVSRQCQDAHAKPPTRPLRKTVGMARPPELSWMSFVVAPCRRQILLGTTNRTS